MAQGSAKRPVQLLQDIEARARRSAAALPQQEDVREEWSGIGFRLGDQPFIAALGEVTEILTFPTLTRVPGAKPWVLGIANVRGNLLPILDLDGYLRDRLAGVNKRSRVLVINHRGVFAGLLVDEVIGLRHFEQANRTRHKPDVGAAVQPYIENAFTSGDETWVVFSMRKLAESPLFLQVAV